MYRLALTGPQTVATIAATREALLAALATQDVVTIDCAAVTEADLTLLQVLLAAHASAQRAGKRLHLRNTQSGALGVALADAGYANRSGPPGETLFWQGEP